MTSRTRRSGLSVLGDVGADLLEGASFGLRDEGSNDNKAEQTDDAVGEEDAGCTFKLIQERKGVCEEERGDPQSADGGGDAVGAYATGKISAIRTQVTGATVSA